LNNLFQDSKKINPKLFSRIGFIILNLFSLAISVVVLIFGSSILKPFNKFINCPADREFECLGISSAYRMSLALVILHTIVIIFSLCGKNVARVINGDCWTLKFFIVFGAYFGFFFISNDFFSVYAHIAKYLSFIFIIYQITVTVSFAHVINIKLVDGLDNDDGCKYKFYLLMLSLIFSGLAIYWIVMSFLNFSNEVYNIVITCLTILFGIAFTLLSVSELVTRKRLLTSLYIFSYISYLNWSALLSQPSTEKNSNNFTYIDLMIEIFYLSLALFFLGFYIKKQPKNSNTEEQKQVNKNPLLEEETVKDVELLNDQSDENSCNDFEITKAFYYFHIFMIFLSIYYCMILTNWNVIENNILTQNWQSFIIKIISLVFTVILYIWVQLAPRLFPDREFVF
jgi:hypothetical protein